MKSPAQIRVVARRQWENPTIRESRLLGGGSAWHCVFSIGRPSPRKICSALDDVKQHIEAWRQVRIGQVVWEPVRYRATSSPVDIPVTWQFSKPTEWIEATGEYSVRQEFQSMATLVEQTASEFHSLLVRRRSLWLGKPLDEVLQASRLALAISPGCAQGQPLRTISLEGIDTKFFERNSRLVTALLDVRFDGEVSLIGLENFLGAFRDSEHWLLVVDLDGSLLPFRKMRIRSSELKETGLSGSRLLIIENESCQHHLPRSKRYHSSLGRGIRFELDRKAIGGHQRVAYWGDIDSWGLQFLAKARTAVPHIEPLLMTEGDFDELKQAAVCEPVVAGTIAPDGLTNAEIEVVLSTFRRKSWKT